MVLVAPQSIPKTSSGKIRRNETRSLYESGKLKINKRAPWVQIIRLWLQNLDIIIGRFLKQTTQKMAAGYKAVMILAVSLPCGILIRLLPCRQAAYVGRWSARVFLRVLGRETEFKCKSAMAPHETAVIVVNRDGKLDPLVLSCLLASPSSTCGCGGACLLAVASHLFVETTCYSTTEGCTHHLQVECFGREFKEPLMRNFLF